MMLTVHKKHKVVMLPLPAHRLLNNRWEPCNEY
jgi:hypothetical protein